MATTFLDLIVVLLWPLALLAAAGVIAINALAETDEISKVVEALTRPIGVAENAKRRDVSLRRSNLQAAMAVGYRVRFRRTRHTAPYISKAKGLAMKRTLLRDDNRRSDRATVAGKLRDHELLENASP